MLKRSLLSAGATALAGTTAGLVWAASRSRPVVSDAPAPEPPPLPPGRVVHVPGHGEMFVRETPAPRQPDPQINPGGLDPPDPPAILLLHGWMFPADLNWFTCYAPLAEVGRVIAADHRGHGRGPRPAAPFRLTDAADDAAALIETLDAGPVVAVGYSMGGAIAQLLWRRHPDLVRGLVLCSTSATFTDSARDRWVWRGMGTLQLVLRLAPRPWWERGVRLQATGRLPLVLTRMVKPETPEDVKQLLPWIFGELARGGAEDLAEAGRELGRYDARDWIGEVDVPTTVLITSDDQLVPPDRQRDLARRIPGAHAVELPFDHDVIVANTDRFVPALREAVIHAAGLTQGAQPAAGMA